MGQDAGTGAHRTARSRARFTFSGAANRSNIAMGESHQGDTPWSRVELVFQAPADGKCPDRSVPGRIRKGSRDGMVRRPGDRTDRPERARRSSSRESSCGPARINPYQYGQFIEYLCTMVPAMWAEKLFDGSFEGLSPYKVAYLKETDFRERPWYPSGATNRASFDRDRSTQVSGDLSL